ncbi:aldehyde ferredoxin oxidoreductase C-terminal domain-containing protein [Desulfosarcina cetonica]|uniref:aldehyde ferredoxin oxidoreductase C-terminal domain-containing protein n=1 Tax=Desulfosarcina cetonica TaxID=90730 RepID=UPI001FF0379A|nr:aldehyde ferredoxin oxidoreductase C-terminal domain-containing protein [Desulfosarcina cetonica]
MPPGCAIQCSGIYVDKDGNFLTKQPEYETVWSHGGNCGISDPDAICRLDFLDDDIGLDTIDMGAAIGVAMEAGIIPVAMPKGPSVWSTRRWARERHWAASWEAAQRPRPKPSAWNTPRWSRARPCPPMTPAP